MLLEVLGVCRRPPAWVTETCADYAKRLGRQLELRFRFITPGQDGIDSAIRRRDEAQRLRKALAADTHVVALDERGEEWTSVEFARRVAEWRERHAHLSFVIGGADGFDADFLAATQTSWSLSRLTLPHLFVQVLVAEQLYRAVSIAAGHPYHRS